jgi:hypothetical protein
MADINPAPPATSDEAEGYERSTIKFPYMDLDDAIVVARAIHGTSGGSPCTLDQLAAKMDLSMKSSGFNVRLATARLFGLIESDRGDAGVKLTSLGQMVMDPAQERAAKVNAFMAVPLYAKLTEHYRGKILPPAPALEREMATMGVAQKQTAKARQAFERSAKTAGFFEFGMDKLVAPSIAPSQSRQEPPPPPPPHEEHRRNGNGGDDDDSGLHPFIKGLLKTLPNPDTDPDWPLTQRIKWLQTAANIFDLMFKGEGGIEVRAAIADRSRRPE